MDRIISVATSVSVIAFIFTLLVCTGCAYRGGKVVDGANLAIGMTIPGTEWSINALDYVGGVRVAGQDSTRITVTNEVAETNDYFGVVTTRRRTRMSATIEPIPPACADGTEQGADGTGQGADGTEQGADGAGQGADGTGPGADGTGGGAGKGDAE